MNDTNPCRNTLAANLFLPTLLFAALGGMTWAVRGCAGYGAAAGCLFAGVTWGAAWWYLARDERPAQSRRYASGWIVLALTVGFGIAGTRGWMQWASFFNGQLCTNYSKGEYVPISRAYGFLWLFLAGVPWAGMGACFLAWCGARRPMTAWLWFLRIACGCGMAYLLAGFLFQRFPEVFLPLYSQLEDRYKDLEANPNLRRLINDNYEAMVQLGLYLGFLLFEILRRDWKNVTLISSVGLLNGIGWALLQNWTWAEHVWPGAQFNFWRCWESSGGISIGIAYGVAYFLVNRPETAPEKPSEPARGQELSSPLWLAAYLAIAAILGWCATELIPPFYAYTLTFFAMLFGTASFLKNAKDAPSDTPSGHNLERWAAYTGLLLGLGLSVVNGIKGFCIIYFHRENEYLEAHLWPIFGPLLLIGLAAISAWVLRRPRYAGSDADPFPHSYAMLWLTLIVQNILAQLVTSSPMNWVETAFALYYVLLFFITAVIVHHYRFMKRC